MRKFYCIAVFTLFLLLAGCGSSTKQEFKRRFPAPPKGPPSVSGVIEDVEFLPQTETIYYQSVVITFQDGRMTNFILWNKSGPFIFTKGKRHTITMNYDGYVIKVKQDG